MPFEFKLPDLGEGVHEGEIVRWLVRVGETIAADQPVVEVMTDKVTAELPSPVAGKVVRLGGEAGDILRVGEVLVAIDTVSSAPASNGSSHAAPTSAGAPVPIAPELEPAAAPRTEAIRAMPSVRHLARELGVELAAVRGTGPEALITAADVRAAAGGAVSTGEPEPTVPTPESAPTAPTEPGIRRVPLRGLRRLIAEHLVHSHQTTAPYTLVQEVDFTELVRFRERVQPLGERSGVHITYLPFIVAAVGMTLREHPELNATCDEDCGDLLIHEAQHIAIAVHTDQGLVVPVIRHVEQKKLVGIAREIERVTQAARAGTLSREDVQGGTFSVTSLGALGGLMGTPMLNTPQVAVLGVHSIAPRAAVRDGVVVPRQMGNLSLTLDHRYIDGYVGALFAQTLTRYLEDPALMLFQLSEFGGPE